jgi:hypothetical protein
MNLYEPIKWSKHFSLKWSDFCAEFNPSSTEDALTTIKYNFNWTVDSEAVNNNVVFFIKNIRLITEFYPMLSWVRPSKATLLLLKHEQGHFDLAEFLRPMFTKKLELIFNKKLFPTKGQNQEQQKQFAREYSNILIHDEFKKLERYVLEKHKEYDLTTNYGILIEKQDAYNEIFQKLHV